VHHDVEQSQTDQQDRFFATALGAGGLEFKSPRPDPIFFFSKLQKLNFGLLIVVQLGNNKKNPKIAFERRVMN
jgi:hypothetical protein